MTKKRREEYSISFATCVSDVTTLFLRVKLETQKNEKRAYSRVIVVKLLNTVTVWSTS